ncbi:hypothetical protein I7I50_01958 [Histoplasma capsulatum G186AR]|uniref:Uncharacterized protein n=1 Tax=Ajellomyces capsulatus TaxID=5037 RepID=A0A8H8CS46_AJECA|nr:hypothetical protein I7I52_12172 [Histoplasma capsulatum]QSS71206.1 hypothetical protein I7I50_01958 [Histoplasma capsulatum G186AR]
MQQPVQRWKCSCRRVAWVCARPQRPSVKMTSFGARLVAVETDSHELLGALGRPDCGQRIKNAARGIDEIIGTAFDAVDASHVETSCYTTRRHGYDLVD